MVETPAKRSKKVRPDGSEADTRGTAEPEIVNIAPRRFERLAAEWKQAKRAMSSISAMAMLPSYQQIIGIGPQAIPFILAQLKREGDQPDMWFWALKAITGDDPVSDENRGDIVAMAKAWMDWGRLNGVS